MSFHDRGELGIRNSSLDAYGETALSDQKAVEFSELER
jgi:hypothetical protein